jgi:hypothetical protein
MSKKSTPVSNKKLDKMFKRRYKKVLLCIKRMEKKREDG